MVKFGLFKPELWQEFSIRLSIGFLLLAQISSCETAFAAPPTRTQTYTPGEIISSDEVTENEDNLYNYVQAGVDTFRDGTIVNADIDSSANIQSEKLNLGSIGQAVSITTLGSFDNNGTSTFDGTVDINSTMTIGTTNQGDILYDNGTSIVRLPPGTDGKILETNGSSANPTWTSLTGDVSGAVGANTVTDLTISGESHGDILYRNATNWVRLAAGTSGQLLQTQGAGANPQWTNGPGYGFTQSSTFTSTDSIAITQTISSGDMYLISLEGQCINSSCIPEVRINSDSAGSDYQYYANSEGGSGGVYVSDTDAEVGDNEIEIVDQSHASLDECQLNSAFMLTLYLQARNSTTELRWEFSCSISGGQHIRSEGSGTYGAGTPTEVDLLNIGGGDFSGRYYVYKYNQS